MSDACVSQWLEQSTGNRKTWARIPAQSKASFFPQKDFQILYGKNPHPKKFPDFPSTAKLGSALHNVLLFFKLKNLRLSQTNNLRARKSLPWLRYHS